MLKTLDVAELRPGMHVQRRLGPWMQLPFWRTSFFVDEARLVQLQVDIDLAASGGRERIPGIESPEKWDFREREKLWLS